MSLSGMENFLVRDKNGRLTQEQKLALERLAHQQDRMMNITKGLCLLLFVVTVFVLVFLFMGRREESIIDAQPEPMRLVPDREEKALPPPEAAAPERKLSPPATPQKAEPKIDPSMPHEEQMRMLVDIIEAEQQDMTAPESTPEQLEGKRDRLLALLSDDSRLASLAQIDTVECGDEKTCRVKLLSKTDRTADLMGALIEWMQINQGDYGANIKVLEAAGTDDKKPMIIISKEPISETGK